MVHTTWESVAHSPGGLPEPHLNLFWVGWNCCLRFAIYSSRVITADKKLRLSESSRIALFRFVSQGGGLEPDFHCSTIRFLSPWLSDWRSHGLLSPKNVVLSPVSR